MVHSRRCVFLLAALLAGPVMASAGEVSLRVAGATHLSSDTIPGAMQDDDWSISESALWSPQSSGTSRLLFGAGYWRHAGELDWGGYHGTVDLVPVQVGARFHFFDERRKTPNLFLEVAPALTYVRLDVDPGPEPAPYGGGGTEDHVLLGTVVSALFPLALTEHLGVEFGASILWTEGFVADNIPLAHGTGFTIVAVEAGLSWR